MSTRRDFLTAFRKPLQQAAQGSSLAVRPPYLLSESFFQSECIVCESKACAASCDEKIIVVEAGGTPLLNFTQSGCTFCEECAKACESGVLSLENSEYAHKINATFRISTEGCIAHHGVICFSCKEPCFENAILFNGMFNPVIDMDRCTGCGLCLSRCPTKAISYFAMEIKSSETPETGSR